jgi:hypothetical protein
MEQPPPERSSRFDPRDPVEAAKHWVTLVIVERDVSAAWRHTAADYRLALAQAVIFLNEYDPRLAGHERDDLARRLAVAEPDHPLWPSFAGLLVEEFAVDLGEIDLANFAAAASTPIGPGLELVLFPPGDGGDPNEPPEMQAHGVLMQLEDDRWVAAGLSHRPATPGWPPDLGY